MPLRRQKEVSAWYDSVAPCAHSSSWARTRLPLQRACSSRMSASKGSAFSAGCTRGTAAVPARSTLRTAPRTVTLTSQLKDGCPNAQVEHNSSPLQRSA